MGEDKLIEKEMFEIEFKDAINNISSTTFEDILDIIKKFGLGTTKMSMRYVLKVLFEYFRSDQFPRSKTTDQLSFDI